MNKKRLIFLIISFIVLIAVMASIQYKSISKKNSTIERYHHTLIQHAKSHLAKAKILIDNFKLDKENYDELVEIKNELDFAGEYIEHFSIYYTYKEKGSYGGNFNVFVFFKAYSHTASDWAMGFKYNDDKKIPSSDEIEKYKKDINRIVERFETYALQEYNHDVKIEDLTFDQLDEIIIELVKKTECEAVKSNMGSPLNEYINVQ